MPKQLLITLEFPPQRGGVASYLEALCGQLDPARTVVLADAARNSFLTDGIAPYALRRERLLYRSLWPRWIRALRAAQRVCREEKIDRVVISHLLPMGYVALALDKPYTVVCHGMDVLMAQRTPLRSMLAGYVLSRAQAIVANSAYTRDLLVRFGADPKKIRIVRPCPQRPRAISAEELDAFKQKNDFKGRRMVLSLGRLVERKGIDRALRALAPLLRRYPDLIYVIAGTGPELTRLELLTKELNIAAQVRFWGDVSAADKPLLYATATAFIFPARRPKEHDVEGYGLVSLEAQSYGVPVIAGNTGGVPETVLNGVTGLLIDADRPATIAQALTALLDHPELALKMGQAGMSHAAACDWTHEIEAVKDIVYTGHT